MPLSARHSTSPGRRTHRRLRLSLPGLFDVGRVLVEDLASQSPSLPGLERILSRGRVDRSGEDWPEPPSAAALGLLGEGRSPGEAYWLRADPVHLRPDQDFLLLWDATMLALSSRESEALVATFNRHFAEDGFELVAPVPDRWYLRTPGILDVQTVSTAAVTGRNIGHFMPRGQDATRLEQMINEAQMLFHDHPVNRERSGSGRLPVSGVWPWGGGSLADVPVAAPADEADRAILAEDPVLIGLAEHQRRAKGPVPASLDAWLGGTHADALVVLEQGTDCAREGDGPGWQQALEALDRDWWQPAVHALAGGQLSELVLQSETLGRYRLTPGLNRRFWRRRRRLPPLLAGLSGEGDDSQ